jgi:2,4-dienoyl-CoA reductase-like NADH-dependent reductase (Old Yellow Enzyme family)
MSSKTFDVKKVCVKATPSFAPVHISNIGSPLESTDDTPTLFTPLRIRSKTMRNRIVVSPMCQYSAAPEGPNIGKLTDWHVATLGHYAIKGAALVFIEATGVQPNGRITPHCPGLWQNDQIESFKRVSDFIKSQGALCGIQLAHAGRKSSTLPPWIGAQQKKASIRATVETDGWPGEVVGPLDQDAWDGKGLDEDGGFYPPRQLSIPEIEDIVKAFAESAQRAVEAGIDVIEVHGAHGYLIHQFLSPITNRRTDQYGGCFENRTRLLLEILRAIRTQIPPAMPLFLRISSTEWMEQTDLGQQYGSWDVKSTTKLATLLPSLGVDLLDVSSGGNHSQQRIQMMSSKGYQTDIAGQLRQELRKADLKLLIGAVGLITEAEQARDIVQETPNSAESNADVIFVARQFLKEPEWVMKVAWKLGVEVGWPNQFWKVRFP